METKEKNFENDIETYLLTKGGYIEKTDHSHPVKQRGNGVKKPKRELKQA